MIRAIIVAVVFSAQAGFTQIQGDSIVAHAVADGYWSASFDSASGGLQKGSQFKLRRVKVHGDSSRTPGGFSGLAASRKNLEALQNEVRKKFLNTGFPFAVIDCAVRPDSSGLNEVDVDFRVQTGDVFKLGEPQLLETRTRPDAALRMALWRTDESFSQERVDLGLRRLRRTGYFESVELAGLFRDSTRNVIYPALRLPDLQGNRLSGLLGYDSKEESGGQLTGFVDLHLINVFGTARDLDFNFENRTGNEREVRAAYVEPWLFRSRVGLRLEADFLQQDTLFWEWNRGVTLFQDLNFTSRLEVALGDQENRDIVFDVHSHAIKSGLRLIVDARDRVPLTVSGYRAEAGALGIRRETGDSSYYVVQGTGVLESWIPLTARFGIRLGLRAASNFPLNRINHGELYFVGGANSLRGYQEREFQTNAYALTRAEFQVALARRGRVFAFTDPGLVNRLVGKYSWRRVLGYGAGIELSRGDWSVSISYALNPERAFGEGLLHAGVDNRF